MHIHSKHRIITERQSCRDGKGYKDDGGGGTMIYKFYNFTLDTTTSMLCNGCGVVDIGQNEFQVLALLVNRWPDTVHKEVFFSEVWTGKCVTDNSLNQAIKKIRVILDNRKSIKTIPGQGFRFDVSVYEITENINDSKKTISHCPEASESVKKELSKIKWEPLSGFHWYVIGGVTASGKNVVSGMSVSRLKSKGIHVITHRKVISRKPRSSNESKMIVVTNEEFDKMNNEGLSLLPFDKKDYKIGFNSDDIDKAITEGVPLISLFKDFSRIPYIYDFLKRKGINFTIFYLKVPAEELQERTRYRNLSEDLMLHKQDNIAPEVESVLMTPGFLEISEVIPNGNSNALQNTVDKIVSIIEQNYKEAVDA